MRVRAFPVIVLLILFVFALASGSLWAHHSIAGVDAQKEVTQHGVVKEFQWRNPHVVVIWDAKDEGGKEVQWIGELGSPTTSIGMGMNKNSLKPGDEIVITFNPSRTNNPFGVIRKITRPDGKLVVATRLEDTVK